MEMPEDEGVVKSIRNSEALHLMESDLTGEDKEGFEGDGE
jgi:hypothetical protein